LRIVRANRCIRICQRCRVDRVFAICNARHASRIDERAQTCCRTPSIACEARTPPLVNRLSRARVSDHYRTSESTCWQVDSFVTSAGVGRGRVERRGETNVTLLGPQIAVLLLPNAAQLSTSRRCGASTDRPSSSSSPLPIRRLAMRRTLLSDKDATRCDHRVIDTAAHWDAAHE